MHNSMLPEGLVWLYLWGSKEFCCVNFCLFVTLAKTSIWETVFARRKGIYTSGYKATVVGIFYCVTGLSRMVAGVEKICCTSRCIESWNTSVSRVSTSKVSSLE